MRLLVPSYVPVLSEAMLRISAQFAHSAPLCSYKSLRHYSLCL